MGDKNTSCIMSVPVIRTLMLGGGSCSVTTKEGGLASVFPAWVNMYHGSIPNTHGQDPPFSHQV